MKKRFEELDSLRGLAAISVLFFHFLIILPLFTSNTLNNSQLFVLNLFKYTPLHIFWAGSEAIVFFFVLSGFVLSLKFYTIQHISYRSFLISRFFRIYLPCYVAVFIAIILDATISRHGVMGLSEWFNSIWKEPITRGMIINHLLLFRYFGYGQYLPVLWTLVMEIRISLIFPLLMLLIKYGNWKISLLTGFALSWVYYVVTSNGASNEILSIPSDYFSTLSFISMFIVGALLAQFHEDLVERLSKFTFFAKISLCICGIVLYTIKFWLFPYLNDPLSPFFADVSITAGVAIFILLALSTRISSILKHRWLHFFGKISYSLYLYHTIILLALIYLLYPRTSLIVIWSIGIALTIVISWLSYLYIEQPAIKLGRRVVKLLESKNHSY